MKKKELNSLRIKNTSEIKKIAVEGRREISLTYAKIKAGQEKNTSLVKKLRRDLAQVLTIIKEKEIIEKEKNEK